MLKMKGYQKTRTILIRSDIYIMACKNVSKTKRTNSKGSSKGTKKPTSKRKGV